jgi:hypothetical protein
MKAVSKVLAVLLIPFIGVWVSFLMTGFAFNPKNVFTSDVFWGISVIYWVFLCPVIFAIAQADGE